MPSPQDSSSTEDGSLDIYRSTHFSQVEGDASSPLSAERPAPRDPGIERLSEVYRAILDENGIVNRPGFRFYRLLGKGGQGHVFLTKCRGADGFFRVVALKIFSPEHYAQLDTYEREMRRIARVASQVARVYHDHLVDVQRFHKRDGVRIMLMEWIDGYDLRRLLHPRMLQRFRERASAEDWQKINDVVVTAGPDQSRLHPGAAITIIRDCLDGLKILHRMGILHGDLKPANIMLRRGGRAKIVDFGSAQVLREPSPQRIFTPAFAAPEVLTARQWTPQCDLASLGYVVIELLAGRRLFPPHGTVEELVETKLALPGRLPHLLPEQVTQSDRLMTFLYGLVAADRKHRFPSAELADLDPAWGAYAFLQELARGGLDAEWRNDLGIWIDQLKS
jgi:serine/threonine-protein kinase